MSIKIFNILGKGAMKESPIWVLFLSIFAFSLPAWSQIRNSDCLECHETSPGEMSGSYDKALELSVHADMACTDCHSVINELPHAEDSIPRVKCGECHAEEDETYQWHGRMKRGENQDIPRCSDCHGKHDIRPSSERDSRVNVLNLPATCGRCHENVDLIKQYDLVQGKAIRMYESSVHGQASLGGVYMAASCNDCHSGGGSAHRILSPGNPESSINHFNIPITCGRCHRNVENDYWEGMHGQLVRRGETDSPVCTNCHGEHGILGPTNPLSSVSPARVAEATCSPCHESAFINEKYGIPSNRLQSWYDSYHGLKSKAGDQTVANCASCHGAHRILPSSNAASSINPNNLQKTCGHCHPGISVAMAATPIHSTPGVSQTPLAAVIANIYILLIVFIIGSMIIHWLMDLRKQIHLVNTRPQTRRMTTDEVWQHTVIMVSFIVLAVTGFALRFSNAFWVPWLFGHEGGFPLRDIIHRTAAVIFAMAVIWHVAFLMTQRGYRFLLDIFPRREDIGHLMQMLKYNLGLAGERPRFGRFTYMEKAEYWALVWGSATMMLTGFFLWFDNLAVQWFPKGFLDVMLVIHYYEAWLAILAILVWHIYGTIFSPAVYPMNPSWLTGKMPSDVYRHEHPADFAPDKDESVGDDKGQEIS